MALKLPAKKDLEQVVWLVDHAGPVSWAILVAGCWQAHPTGVHHVPVALTQKHCSTHLYTTSSSDRRNLPTSLRFHRISRLRYPLALLLRAAYLDPIRRALSF